MPVYRRHVFVCTRGEWCPAVDGDGLGVHRRLKELVKQAGLRDEIRVNHCGCFSQCGNGPMVVVYPEGVWYARVAPEDVEQLFGEHLLADRPVERLRYDPPTPGSHQRPRDGDGRPIGRPERTPEGLRWP